LGKDFDLDHKLSPLSFFFGISMMFDNQGIHKVVIPAEAGIQGHRFLGSGFLFSQE
jgi:hypothetical protein